MKNQWCKLLSKLSMSKRSNYAVFPFMKNENRYQSYIIYNSSYLAKFKVASVFPFQQGSSKATSPKRFATTHSKIRGPWIGRDNHQLWTRALSTDRITASSTIK